MSKTRHKILPVTTLPRKLKVHALANTLYELERIGVIKIDKKGNIHKTKFGMEIYRHMKMNGMFD